MKPRTLMTLRRYHSWLGVFFAPTIILFSISGALQTFRLQEEKGYGGTPPSWIVWLASVHKDQMRPRDKSNGDAGPKLAAPASFFPKPANAPIANRANPIALKIFVVLMALALLASTLVGLTIALANRHARRKYLVALAAGVIMPIVLLWV